MNAAVLVVSLGLTLLIELTAAYLWGLRERDLALCTAVNVLTNPAVVICNTLLRAHLGSGFGTQLLLEGGAVFVEAVLYCRYGKAIRRPVWLAVCANVVSYGLGLILMAFG